MPGPPTPQQREDQAANGANPCTGACLAGKG